MATTYSSLSHGFSAASSLKSGPENGPTVDVSSTEQQTITIAVGVDPSSVGDGTIGAFAQGTATAVGTDTLALGTISATAEAGTAYDSAHAEADFLAVGVGGIDDLAFASAEVYVELTGSFDIVISTSSSTSTSGTVGDTSFWFQQSSVSVTGIDIGGSLASGTGSGPTETAAAAGADAIDSGPDSSNSLPDFVALSPAPGDTDIDFDISGNIAALDFYAFASGQNSFADAIISVFALEDQLSSIDAIVIAEVAF